MRSRDVGPYKSERSPKLRHCANTNDNATMNECKAYIENIYKSIKQNLNTLDPNEDLAALQGVVDAFRAFYVSLFAQRIGNIDFSKSAVFFSKCDARFSIPFSFCRCVRTKADGRTTGESRSKD